MPQMAPIMWTYLFLMFSTLFVFSLIKVYFNKKLSLTSTPMNFNQSFESTNMNWKW